MASLARKHKRKMQRAFARTSIDADGIAAFKEIAKSSEFFEETLAKHQARIEENTRLAFSIMTLWVLHDKFGFGARKIIGKDGSTVTHGRLQKFWNELSELGDAITGGFVTMDDLYKGLIDECGIDLRAKDEAGNTVKDDLPAILGGKTICA